MNKKLLRVLHVVGKMDRAGVETWLMQVLRRVNPQEFDFHFCVFHEDPGAYAPEIRQLGGTIVTCKLSEGRITFARRLTALMAQGQYDIVHSQMHSFSGLALRSAAKAGVPVRIAHFHNTRSGGTKRGVGRRLYEHAMYRLLQRHSTHILGCSRAVMKTIFGPNWSKDPRRQVLYCGTDLTRFEGNIGQDSVRKELGIPSAAPIAMHVGRFAPQKNHQLLIEIASGLARLKPDVHWCLVGKGPLEATIRCAAKEGKIDSIVHLLGVRDDVPRLMKASDVFVFPSLWEGLGLVLLEAQAAGLPIVASDLQCIREAVENYPAAKLIDLSADISEWVKATQHCLSHPIANRAEALNNSKQRLIANVDKCAEILCNIYRNAMKENSRE